MKDQGELSFNRYPYQPGFKRDGTSREAAIAMEPRAGTLRGMVLDYIRLQGKHGATPEEAAAVLHESDFAIRPRVTELHKQGFIVESGEKRLNRSGRWAMVWVSK